MIFLDTNAVIWLYQAELEKFSVKAKSIMEKDDLFASPLVKLELQYLFEIKRINLGGDKILRHLYDVVGLNLHNVPLTLLIEKGLAESWTRDPFDRLITAHAKLENAVLVTRDRTILQAYQKAVC